MSDEIKPEEMSDAQIREYAEKEYERRRKELSEHNFNAILVGSLRHYVKLVSSTIVYLFSLSIISNHSLLQRNWPKEDHLCVDVLGCQHSGDPAKIKLAELWNENFPGKLEAFMAKVHDHKVDFNQEHRKNLAKATQDLDQLLSGEELSNISVRNRSFSKASQTRSKKNDVPKTLEEKIKIIADGCREMKIDYIELEVHEKIFQNKLRRLESLAKKYLGENLAGAQAFIDSKNSTIELLTAKLE